MLLFYASQAERAGSIPATRSNHNLLNYQKSFHRMAPALEALQRNKSASKAQQRNTKSRKTSDGCSRAVPYRKLFMPAASRAMIDPAKAVSKM